MIAESHDSQEIDRYFRATVALNSTRLFLTVDEPPQIEIGGTRKSMNREPISSGEMKSLVLSILSAEGVDELNRNGKLRFVRSVEKNGKEFMFDVEVIIESDVIALFAILP